MFFLIIVEFFLSEIKFIYLNKLIYLLTFNYSSMANLQSLIKQHNSKVLAMGRNLSCYATLVQEQLPPGR